MLRPFTLNGEVWRVVLVEPGDPRLVDRTGTERLATTNPSSRTVSVSSDIMPPLLDKIILHEIAHAVTISYDLLHALHEVAPRSSWQEIEEWAVRLVENYGIEVAEAASHVLGRPVCVEGVCHD